MKNEIRGLGNSKQKTLAKMMDFSRSNSVGESVNSLALDIDYESFVLEPERSEAQVLLELRNHVIRKFIKKQKKNEDNDVNQELSEDKGIINIPDSLDEETVNKEVMARAPRLLKLGVTDRTKLEILKCDDLKRTLSLVETMLDLKDMVEDVEVDKKGNAKRDTAQYNDPMVERLDIWAANGHLGDFLDVLTQKTDMTPELEKKLFEYEALAQLAREAKEKGCELKGLVKKYVRGKNGKVELVVDAEITAGKNNEFYARKNNNEVYEKSIRPGDYTVEVKFDDDLTNNNQTRNRMETLKELGNPIMFFVFNSHVERGIDKHVARNGGLVVQCDQSRAEIRARAVRLVEVFRDRFRYTLKKK